ncbi:NAD(P)/FAD-dependent oxidoreductase [Mucilaginibacter terrenus]|uniref:NADH:ubiquinone reductase (non-electrogenic) n=1 Tax=Mucilaginibacter terrenus TaxID=2482727 RepID=A0A3E2NVV1_9SPHI|nr:NAD(P)/FAD-dependent oxidoreductase [Mucilaginibacter terrenus]RFZ85146.1 NAD(P)/FAD-dependent oxidoreductase [Mucilaginibacter terrenus]
MENKGQKKLLIVGGGFAGMNLAREVMKSEAYQITLIDKNNYNYFPPLLYQVATSFLDPSSISYPFRKLFRNEEVRFRMGELIRIDPVQQIAYLNDAELPYDELVFATGARTNYFGNENVKKYALPMKTIDDALLMRNSLLKTLEQASTCTDPEERRKLLTIVVAGGGPTGVEVSGMLAEMKKNIILKDYPEIKNSGGEIYIVDGGSSLLAPMSEKTHEETKDVLIKLGVRVKLNTRVTNFEHGIVTLTTGEMIEAKTLIWAAGITANSFDGIAPEMRGAGQRMITDEHNKVNGLNHVYAIGDSAIMTTDPAYPRGHPQLAQVAIQQGRNLARNFIAMANNKTLKPFIYFDKGDMAIVGRHNAVVDMFKHKVHLKGFAALFIWLFIHLISLVTYTNKLRTLYNWTIAYISRDQSLRMIFRS